MSHSVDRADNRTEPVGRRFWLKLSMAAALLAIVGNVIALAVKSIYAGLTPAFFPQALAQDIANLAIVAPLWIVAAVLALRGSMRAYLLWLGVLTFTVYNYFIYAFSIPFGPLFLLWVAVLGMSLYALIGGVASAHHLSVRTAFSNAKRVTVSAWSLMIIGVLFGLLWLSEDIPALLKGVRPQSLIDMAIPTNPVHILDLGFFLPAALAVGMMLLKNRPLAYTLAPAFIVFLILTGLPILVTPVIQSLRGAAAEWGVVVPIGTLTAGLAGLLFWLLKSVRAGSATS